MPTNRFKRPHMRVSNEVAALGIKDAKKIFWGAIQTACPEVRLDERLSEALNALTLYALRRPGRLDPNKGLLIIGPVGVGKNTLMSWLAAFEQILHGTAWRAAEVRSINEQYTRTGPDSLTPYHDGTWCFHDVAALDESLAVYMGTRTHPVLDVMYRYYDHQWLREGRRLMLTSNLPLPDLSNEVNWATVYGKERQPIYSRVTEMCNTLVLLGPDKRPTLPA